MMISVLNTGSRVPVNLFLLFDILIKILTPNVMNYVISEAFRVLASGLFTTH